jgi:hypothetical protein
MQRSEIIKLIPFYWRIWQDQQQWRLGERWREAPWWCVLRGATAVETWRPHRRRLPRWSKSERRGPAEGGPACTPIAVRSWGPAQTRRIAGAADEASLQATAADWYRSCWSSSVTRVPKTAQHSSLSGHSPLRTTESLGCQQAWSIINSLKQPFLTWGPWTWMRRKLQLWDQRSSRSVEW